MGRFSGTFKVVGALAITLGFGVTCRAYQMRTQMVGSNTNNQIVIVCRQTVKFGFPCPDEDTLTLDAFIEEESAPLRAELSQLREALTQERKNNDRLAKSVDELSTRVQSLEGKTPAP